MGLGNMIKNLLVKGLKILSNLTCKISNVTCRSNCCVFETHGVEISHSNEDKNMKKRKLPPIPEN